MPSEPIDACAQRELAEETGLTLPFYFTECGDFDWFIYWAEAPLDAAVALLDAEHDRYEWLAPDEALRRIAPERVRQGVARVIARFQTHEGFEAGMAD